MSLVTIVKDTTNFVQFLIQEPFPLAVSHFLGWFLGKCVSFLSFKWLINLPLFPIFIPKLSTQVIQEGLNLTSTDQSFEHLGFFPAAQSGWNRLIPGLLNSFFLVLPFSPARILWIRRLIIQGIPAGVSSGLGLIVGQFLFLGIVMFGFRPVLSLWSALEPFSFLIGLTWFLVIFDQLCSKKTVPVDWDDKKLCIQLFLQSLFLGCVEQTTLGQYLSGLTTTSESFFNEGFDSTSQLQFYLGQMTYLIGIGLGLCAFGTLLGWGLWKGSQIWYQTSSLPYQMWKMQQVHPILILIYGSAILSSIPYYSWDYLFAKPLGFVPDDKGLDKVSSNWVGITSDPQLPRWRDYYMRVSGGEAGILGDGWVWSRYDKTDYPASRKRRALEAMLISHEWFPHWAKDRGLLNMEYYPAQQNILKRFSRKIGSLTLPGGDRLRDLIWPKDRRERTIARDSVRGVKNWSPGRLSKLQTFWGNLKKSKGVTRSELLQASRYLTFGRLRSLPVSKEESLNPFVDINSKRSLGHDSISPMVSTWVEKTRVNQGINTLDNKFSVFTEDGGFPISVKKQKNSVFDLWLATRSQVIPEFETRSKEFQKFHKYWVVRNLIKPRVVQWRLKPSEENYLWMAEQDLQDKSKGSDFSFLFEEAEKLKNNESNLLRLQHYLEVGKKLSEQVPISRTNNSKSLEPSVYSQVFKPLKLQSPPINPISAKRNRVKYRRSFIKHRRYDPRVRNRRIGGSNFSVDVLRRRSIIFGLRNPHFLQTRDSQRKGDRRLWRRRTPLRPSPVGPSRWSSFNYYRQQVYHQALSHVVDNVMKGQPKDYYLTTAEEKALARRKVQLARYYDSLRSYQKSPRFQRFVPGGSRTFTDGVYNHQFKGTLSYARRLFYVTPLDAQNMEGGRVYKMSQLLYDKQPGNPMLHEELTSPTNEKQPFLELMPSPSPLYTGWDTNNHKMILTSRTLPRVGAGYRVPSMEGSFTAWPYTTEKIREVSRPRVFNREKKNMVVRSRMAFKWDWKNLQLGFSWRTTPRSSRWYDASTEEAINTKAPLGYWARSQTRQVFRKQSLRRRRWNRWYLRIPALPRLGGFSWDA